MSSIVTDELLCKYIVDSGTLTSQQLEVVRSYLCTNADEADMVAGISMSLYESDVEDNTDSLNHACAIVPFSDEEIEQRRECGRIRMLELLDDIMVERTEQELLAHFDNQLSSCQTEGQIPLDEQQERLSVAQVVTMQ
jgi:hypothetical protein